MSYARFGCEDSDVYVFFSVGDWLECCGCPLLEETGFVRVRSTDEMLVHLDHHRQAGHVVPDSLVAGLEQDRAENDATMRRASASGSRVVL